MVEVFSSLSMDAVANAVKQGFSAPDATWFRGDSIDYVKRVLFDRKAVIYDVLNSTAVQGLVQEHLDGKQNRRLLVWSLLYLETFMKTFMTGNVGVEPAHV